MIVELWERGGAATVLSPEVRFEVVRFGSAAVGGPDWAEIEVHGALDAVLEMLNWLRWRVEVRTPLGTPLWWGFVNEVVVRWGGLEVGWSLEEMANRVKVLYTTTDVDGAMTAQETAWAEDGRSQGEYGVKELILSIGAADEASALLRRDGALRPAPPATPTIQAGAGARWTGLLRCVGEWRRLGWQYAQREEGRAEFDGETHHSMPIGWALGSTKIGFWRETIQCLAAGLEALAAGHVVTVSGSASNNGTFTVEQPAQGEIESYTATTISFDAVDDIMDVAGGLGFVERDRFIEISGSASNNGFDLIAKGGADHCETLEGFTGNISTAAAGPSVTIGQGQALRVTTTLTQEAPGASVTLTLHGAGTAQRFHLATGMVHVHQVAVRVGKVGSPTDDFIVELRADNSGAPTGTLLATGTLAGAAMGESVDWRWLTLDADVTLGDGDWWLVARRAGSDEVDYFCLGMVEEAHEACMSWDGAAWSAHASGWYMPFKVWSQEDIGEQIDWLLAEGGGHFRLVEASPVVGVGTNPYMEGPLTYLDAIEKLIEVGVESGERLTVGVSAQQICRVEEAAGSSADNRLLSVGEDGSLRLLDWAGTAFEEGVLPVGEWVELVDLPEALLAVEGVTPVFVERASWDRRGGLRVEVRGAPRLADLGRVRQG